MSLFSQHTVICMWNCTSNLTEIYLYIFVGCGKSMTLWPFPLSLWHYDADVARYKYKQISFCGFACAVSHAKHCSSKSCLPRSHQVHVTVVRSWNLVQHSNSHHDAPINATYINNPPQTVPRCRHSGSFCTQPPSPDTRHNNTPATCWQQPQWRGLGPQRWEQHDY